MNTLFGIDISNYSGVPTSTQAQCWWDNDIRVVCIGLQKAAIARAQQAALTLPFWREYYIDIPGRDLSIPERGSKVWIDVEPGCFVTREDVGQAIKELLTRGLEPSIYGNETSIKTVLGNGHDWANIPLDYANYPNNGLPPDFDLFKPFDGWLRPRAWQYAGSKDLCGVNVDLDVFEVTGTPVPPPTVVTPDAAMRAGFRLSYFIDQGYSLEGLPADTKEVLLWVPTQFKH